MGKKGNGGLLRLARSGDLPELVRRLEVITATEEIDCECDLDAGEVRFAHSILAGMVDVGGGSTMQLHITDSGSPMLILDPEDDGLTVIAMPKR